MPRAPCDNFVCDFPYGFSGRRMWLRATAYVFRFDYRAIFCADSRGLIGTNPYGGCAEIVYTAIVQFQCSHRTASASFLWDRTEPAWLPCRGCTEIRLYGDDVTMSWNMAGSSLRYDLKSPHDSRINSCIRVSKCPRVTSLSSYASPRPFSLCASVLPAALPERPRLQCTPAPF